MAALQIVQQNQSLQCVTCQHVFCLFWFLVQRPVKKHGDLVLGGKHRLNAKSDAPPCSRLGKH